MLSSNVVQHNKSISVFTRSPFALLLFYLWPVIMLKNGSTFIDLIFNVFPPKNHEEKQQQKIDKIVFIWQNNQIERGERKQQKKHSNRRWKKY